MTPNIKLEERERLKKVIEGAIGPHAKYCDGYGCAGASGQSYISAITLATGHAPMKFSHPGSSTLDEINAYDLAEADKAYIGQVNMISASSFCGPLGGIWGYDFAKIDGLRDKKKNFEVRRKDIKTSVDEVPIPVYSAKPLVIAAQKLFGTRTNRNFPLIPGAHVRFAYKDITKRGPKHIYCGLGIGFPKDRNRDAVLFMEDIGELKTSKRHIEELLAKSIVEIGRNQCVRFEEIFVHVEDVLVEEGEIGCALVAVPYLVLAKGAKPSGDPINLMNITLNEWEETVKESFLDTRAG